MPDDARPDLEGLLDRAISRYADVELPPGLENRVLQGATARRKRTWAFWWKIAAAPALAALVLFAVLTPRSERVPAARTASVVKREPSRPEMPSAVSSAGKVRRTVQQRVLRAAPKRSQFPGPAPLTPGEAAFLSLASAHPELAREASRAPSPPQFEAIQIEPIEVRPLGQDSPAPNKS